jgi:hypothetical protein
MVAADVSDDEDKDEEEEDGGARSAARENRTRFAPRAVLRASHTA